MSYFLRHVAGFFIQIYPCVYLCLLPFGEASYRFRRKRVLLIYTALSLIFSLIFPAIPLIPVNGRVNGTFSNLYMLLVMLLFVGGYLYIIREKPIKKLLVISLVVFYAAAQFLIVNTIIRGIIGRVGGDVYSLRTLLAFAITTAVLFPPTLRFIGREVREYLIEIDPGSMRKDYLWALCISVIYFALMFYYATTPVFVMPQFWMITGPTFLFVTVVIFSFYYALFREAVRRKREETLRRYEEIQRAQARKIEGDIESARRMRHDMRHHLREIYTAVNENRREDALAYLSGVIEQTQSREAKRFCENQIVNGLLQYYTDWAESEGIRCTVKAKCDDIPLDAADLTVIFGNVLENAIEACKQSEMDKRYIDIDMGVVGSSLLFQVKNRCEAACLLPGAPLQDGFAPAEAFASARPDGGMGLKSVSHTARRYGGVARFAYDPQEKVFVSQVRMNFKPEGAERA